ncbi:MAG: carbohydrate-binding family 9-like protein [Thermoanaerobaculia bacterium]
MTLPVLVVPRVEFSIEDPWEIPSVCTPVLLRCTTDGSAPRMKTSVAAHHDGDVLTIVFKGDDDEIVATFMDHDQPLWKEDAFEVFLAPSGLTPYFEIEVNPLGTTFDARIDSPDGVRETMTTDLDWTCDGLFAALRRDDGRGFQAVIRLPFESLGGRPKSGDEWRGNFFRIDRSVAHGDDFSAWQPALKSPPDFHVAALFGALRFA